MTQNEELQPPSSEQELSSAFEKLNAPHESSLTRHTRMGIYVSWMSIFILIGLFALLATYVAELDERAEQVRLQQSLHEVNQTVDNRLGLTADVTQRASVRMIMLPHSKEPPLTADLTAQSLMQDRPEIYEVALINHNRVVRSWTNPSQSGAYSLFKNDAPDAPIPSSIQAQVDAFVQGQGTFLSKPYVAANSNFVYINLLVSTPISSQIIFLRINLTRMIADAADLADAKNYYFLITYNGEPLTDAGKNDESKFMELRSSVRMNFIPDPGYDMEALSYNHNLFDYSTYNLWTISGLALALVVIAFLLIRTQKAQLKSHQRLTAEYALRVAISDSAMAGLRVTDQAGRIQFVNKTFENLVGFSAKELIGKTMPYPYWDDAATAMTESLLAHPKEPVQQSLEIRVRRKDGRVLDAQINVSPLLNEQKQLIGWVGELYDITEQKQARKRMRAAQERFTRVVQSMSSAISVVRHTDHESTLLFSNDIYDELFGHSDKASWHLLELVNKSPSRMVEEVYDEVSQLWLNVQSKQITWTDDLPATLIIATDITQQHQIQAELDEQRQRAESTQRLVTMGEMASSLAHELNQPLAAISNYASGAAMKLDRGRLTENDAQDALGKIDKQARRAGEIIRRIRGFAKRADPQLSTINPYLVISETMELAQLQAQKLKATLTLNIAENLPMICGDVVMLEQLLLNLLKNAMESATETGNMDVTLEVEFDMIQDAVLFSVIDHGTGVADDAKPHLFDAFYSTKSEGMGMGLNICRSIIEFHQGRIIVTDTPGGGATFTFTVPVAHDGACEDSQPT